jgi:hypothetical protein
MVEVEPWFELVANIVGSFHIGYCFVVFHVKIKVGLSLLAKTVSEVRKAGGED